MSQTDTDRRTESEKSEFSQKAIELGRAFDKKRKIYKAIFLSVVLAVLFGLSVAVILLLREVNSETVGKTITIAAIIIFVVCLYVGDWVVINFSKKLKVMQKELDILNREIYPNIFAAGERNKPVREKNFADKVKLIVGISVFVIGCISLIAGFIVMDIFPPQVFVSLFLFGIWLGMYSLIVMFSKRVIRGMYYPTMTLLTIASPSILTAWLVRNVQGWLHDFFIGSMMVFGLFLFAVFMYFSVYRPDKESRQFGRDNKDLFEEREAEQEGLMTEIINAKKDRALISVRRNTRHRVTVEKYVSTESPHFEKVKESEFVEYHNAYFAAVKEIVALYKTEDGREETALEQRARRLAEANINELIDKLKACDFLKNKIDIIDDGFISIDFHQYLTVKLSDDYCEYFNTHWHPCDNEEAAEFIDNLMNERIIFYQNRLTRRRKQYDGIYLEKLLKTKNKKFCKVYSAMQIYVDK